MFHEKSQPVQATFCELFSFIWNDSWFYIFQPVVTSSILQGIFSTYDVESKPLCLIPFGVIQSTGLIATNPTS